MTLPRALVIGHSPPIHRALREHFSVEHIVAVHAETATELWDDVYNLRRPLTPPSWASLNDGCLEAVLTHYFQFEDINSRRFATINAPESENFNSFIASFHWAHRLLTEKRIEVVFFHNLPHEGFDYVVYRVARYLNIRTIVTHQCLMPARFWIFEDIDTFGDFSRAPTLYEKEPSNYVLPTTWYYMANITDKWIYTLGDMLKETLRRPWRLPVAALRYHYNRVFLRHQRDSLSRPVAGERFIYVPLHMQPELTTSAMGGPSDRYADQVGAIEQLSLLVPEGVWLYIKENPKQGVHQRGPLFFRRLAALPNVKFVSTRIPSMQLVKDSIGVATITGTAGWEALFHGRPVMVFGNAWYSPFTGVTRYTPGVTFDDWMRNVPPDHARLNEELDTQLMKSGRGVVDADHSVIVDGFDREENGRRVAASLARYWDLTRTGAPA